MKHEGHRAGCAYGTGQRALREHAGLAGEDVIHRQGQRNAAVLQSLHWQPALQQALEALATDQASPGEGVPEIGLVQRQQPLGNGRGGQAGRPAGANQRAGARPRKAGGLELALGQCLHYAGMGKKTEKAGGQRQAKGFQCKPVGQCRGRWVRRSVGHVGMGVSAPRLVTSVCMGGIVTGLYEPEWEPACLIRYGQTPATCRRAAAAASHIAARSCAHGIWT